MTWQTLRTAFPLGTKCLYLKVAMANRSKPMNAAPVEIQNARTHLPFSSMYDSAVTDTMLPRLFATKK
uniref:Uncharacterized protein n=1 Tax=Arundo donax TaxID=35708 RepID=A0A0A9HEI6_ARUDO